MKFNLYYLLIISILICSKGLSQKNTYRIIHKNKTSNLLEFRVAIEKADFNKMRFKTKRREITFLNGPTIELLSAQELISKGFKIELSECIDESSLNHYISHLPKHHLKTSLRTMESVHIGY